MHVFQVDFPSFREHAQRLNGRLATERQVRDWCEDAFAITRQSFHYAELWLHG